MTKTRYSFFIVCALLLSACHTATGKCKPYFQFDQVEHYNMQIDEQRVMALEQKKRKTKKEEWVLQVVAGNTQDQLADTAILKKMQQLGFKKKVIAKSKLQDIAKIFCEKQHDEMIAFTCMPIYRDVLVFTRSGRTVGTARICFACDQHHITGTTANTTGFGQSGDYERLSKILYPR